MGLLRLLLNLDNWLREDLLFEVLYTVFSQILVSYAWSCEFSLEFGYLVSCCYGRWLWRRSTGGQHMDMDRIEV